MPEEKLPIKVYVPNEEHRNINSDWERVIVKWPMAYWIEVRKSDHKCRIGYDIDPDQLTPETYEEVWLATIPSQVYKMFTKKVRRDLDRMKAMKINLEHNIEFVKDFRDTADWLLLGEWELLQDADYEVLEFTPDDEAAERQAEIERYRNLNKQQENKKVLDRKKQKRQKKK